MCGIAGFFDPRFVGKSNELKTLANKMIKTMHHRGPDDQQTWVSPELGMALCHSRLSIQDLSPAGRQPMASHCGRYIIVYNGEVYNAPSLRKELEKKGSGIKVL